MMKSFLLIILTLVLSTGLMAKTKGSFKMLTQEEYSQLSDAKKDQYHVLIMELMVELESQYQIDTKAYGLSSARKEKYQKALFVLQNFFIPSAIAAAPSRSKTIEEYAEDFKLLSSRTGVANGNCVFAGWVSRVEGSICVHPMAQKIRAEEEHKRYPKDPSKGCSAAEMKGSNIQCNPLIFGYKNAANKTLFCVPTDNLAENSSFQCMKKALESTERPGVVDSKSARMKVLRKAYSKNGSTAFNSVFNFNLKSCICPAAPDGYSVSYQNHIRPKISDENASGKFQACYGMMKMMSETLTVMCNPSEGTPSPIPENITKIFNEFKTHTTSKMATGNDAKSSYNEFIRQNLQQGEAKTAYESFCSVTGPVVTPEDQDEQRSPTCKIACVPKAVAAADSNTRKSSPVLSCEASEIKVPGPNNTFTNVANPVITQMAVPTELPGSGDISISFTGEGITNAKTASCVTTYAEAPEVTGPTCQAQCTHTPGTPAAGITAAVVEKNECIPTITTPTLSIRGTPPATIAKDANPISVTYIVPASGAQAVTSLEQTISCPTTWKTGAPGGEVITEGEPSLALSKAADGETKVKVTGTATDAVGWSIHLKAETPGLGSAPSVLVSAAVNKSEHSFERKPVDYEVCGYLEKTPDKKSNTCIKIDKLGAPVARTNEAQTGRPINTPKLAPPQPAFMRHGSDTSARGIK